MLGLGLGLTFQSTSNVNQEPTDISLSAATIIENNLVGDVIGVLSTTDPDTGNTFTYTKVAGTGDTDNASFDISGANLIALAVYNFATKSSYSIRIRSTDQDGKYFEKAFTITISSIDALILTALSDTNTKTWLSPTQTNGAKRDVNGNENIWYDIMFGSTAREAELSSGNIVVMYAYEITACQANFFYTGCAVGDGN